MQLKSSSTTKVYTRIAVLICNLNDAFLYHFLTESKFPLRHDKSARYSNFTRMLLESTKASVARAPLRDLILDRGQGA